MDVHFNRIEQLVVEMNQFVPQTATSALGFRADLAGLLVVTIAASYESCVKETLVSYAGRHHIAFETFASNNFSKLNSRISVADLYGYAKTFNEVVDARFKTLLAGRKEGLNVRLGKNIETAYKQILNWRHDFAHAGIRNTTIEEAISTHRLAKRVLYAFDDAFCGR